MAQRIGLIGLGLVGSALAKRLIASGRAVVGFDIAPEACDQAAELGVEIARSAPEVASESLTLLLSLPDSDVVTCLLWEEGLAEALRPGALVLDTTTGRPADATASAQRLAELGVRYVDAPLSGSSEEIAKGTATALVGAPEPEPELLDLLEVFARQVFFLGQPGAGRLAKLVVNHVMGLNRAALAEGLALGLAAGLDGAELLEVLRGSAANSRALELKGRRMVEGDFSPASRIAQHAKDVALILELARSLGARVPLEEVHSALLLEAIRSGLGNLDNAALIKVFRKEEGDKP
jgi:3-hydroxyisobutyrate dehydrogenase-like beta-hydroxyacid dehydrogenase